VGPVEHCQSHLGIENPRRDARNNMAREFPSRDSKSGIMAPHRRGGKTTSDERILFYNRPDLQDRPRCTEGSRGDWNHGPGTRARQSRFSGRGTNATQWRGPARSTSSTRRAKSTSPLRSSAAGVLDGAVRCFRRGRRCRDQADNGWRQDETSSPCRGSASSTKMDRAAPTSSAACR